MENLVEEVERVAESGNLKVGLTKAVSGAWPWQDHSHHIHWLLLGQLGPACAGKLLGGGWPCAGTLEIQLKFNRNFNEIPMNTHWKSS